MTGYLERLAASASSRGGAIHPVLRPIYASLSLRDAGEPPQLETHMMVSASPGRTQEPGFQSHAERKAGAATGETGPLAPTPNSPTRQARSVFSRMDRSEWPPADTGPVDKHPAKRRGEAVPADVPIAAQRLIPDEPQAPSKHLLAQLADWPRGAGRVTHTATGGAPRWPEADAPQASGRTACVRCARERTPEKDDIQIHIGRIEVTAVQPAPLQVAPVKSVRHALSLEEYLKRRNGGMR